MKQSRYTIVEQAPSGEHLLFNTATGAFAALDDEAFAMEDVDLDGIGIGVGQRVGKYAA